MTVKLLDIPKQITRGDDLVVLKKTEFMKLIQQLDETRDALQAIREGEAAYKKGKTRIVASLSELL